MNKTKKNIYKKKNKKSKKAGSDVRLSYVFSKDPRMPKYNALQYLKKYETVPLENKTINQVIDDYFYDIEIPSRPFAKWNSDNENAPDGHTYDLKRTIRQINQRLPRDRRLKLSGNKSQLAIRINDFYKTYYQNKKNNIIKQYGKIENWDLSKITIMNPDVRMAYELNTEFQRKKAKVPMIKELEIDKKKERERMRMDRHDMLNEDLKNLSLTGGEF